ncbi:MAG: hypothetical protein M1305_05130 [Candidatus Marsarchaeota archaeon]|nr:hypothetical protein [Candidatus Marsarchaeota archaeon]
MSLDLITVVLTSLHSQPRISLAYNEIQRLGTSQETCLTETGLLRKTSDVDWVACDECADGCVVRVERVCNSEGVLTAAFCRCEERDDIVGRIPIPIERLCEWHTAPQSLARFLSEQLGFKEPAAMLAADRIWRLGPIRYAGHRADVFLAVAPAADDFPLLWANVASAVDQCSTPVMLVPGETPVAQFDSHKAKVLSLTRLLYMDNGRLMLDASELRLAAGIAGSPPVSHNDSFIHNEDYTAVSMDGVPYVLTTNQAMVIKALHQAYQQRTYWLGKDYLLVNLLETNSERLRDTFKSNLEAWKGLIVNDKRGRYRLNLPI